MKKTTITACILLLSAMTLFSQENDLKKVYTNVTTAINSALITQAGSIEISGAFSYHSFETRFIYDEKMKQQSFLFEPVCSYFFMDNISLGLDFSYLNQKTDFDYPDMSQTIEQIFAGPLLKIYLGDNRVRPFIVTDYLFMIGDHYKGRVLDVGAGIFYHAAGNFGFNLFGKYGFMSALENQIDSQNRLFIGVGITNFIL